MHESPIEPKVEISNLGERYTAMAKLAHECESMGWYDEVARCQKVMRELLIIAAKWNGIKQQRAEYVRQIALLQEQKRHSDAMFVMILMLGNPLLLLAIGALVYALTN